MLKLRLSYLLLVTSFLGFTSHASTLECARSLQALLNRPLSHYVEAARQQARDRGVQLPHFHDADQAVQAARTWQGEAAPNAWKGALPANVSFVDHEVFMTNEPGLVKMNAAMTTLRAQVLHRGREIGTNVGVRGRVLWDNLGRNQKSLVSKDAKAVVLFIHGGGTTTTGHHVGVNMMYKMAPYNVDVISFDQLWHAEGPRAVFENSRDYFDYVREIIKTHIQPAGVPVFIAGHSMGGIFSDMYMRLYPNDDLVKGVVSLSMVPDLAPGGTAVEKVLAAERMNVFTPEEATRLARGEDLTSDQLTRDGKITLLADMYEGNMSLANDWSIPSDGGHSLIPGLFMTGTGDRLYVGKEGLYAKYVAALPNVEFIPIGDRFTLASLREAKRSDRAPKKERIGHMIFDTLTCLTSPKPSASALKCTRAWCSGSTTASHWA